MGSKYRTPVALPVRYYYKLMTDVKYCAFINQYMIILLLVFMILVMFYANFKNDKVDAYQLSVYAGCITC